MWDWRNAVLKVMVSEEWIEFCLVVGGIRVVNVIRRIIVDRSVGYDHALPLPTSYI